VETRSLSIYLDETAHLFQGKVRDCYILIVCRTAGWILVGIWKVLGSDI
jgi:hypothetical protein